MDGRAQDEGHGRGDVQAARPRQQRGRRCRGRRDIEWITRGQLSDQLDEAIFATAIGAVSEVVDVSGDGSYLFRILAEETRELTEEQLEIVKTSGFSYWYTREKEKADIEYTLGTSSLTG